LRHQIGIGLRQRRIRLSPSCADKFQIVGLRHFNRAHPSEMIGHKLAIEQTITAAPHQRDEPCQRNLAGIVSARKHALTAKDAVEADAI
jgi:hypothetical protein